MSMPARPDEVALWSALVAGEQPRYAGDRLGVPRNRVRYLCSKWARQHRYNWGVVIDLGWIEPQEGPQR